MNKRIVLLLVIVQLSVSVSYQEVEADELDREMMKVHYEKFFEHQVVKSVLIVDHQSDNYQQVVSTFDKACIDFNNQLTTHGFRQYEQKNVYLRLDCFLIRKNENMDMDQFRRTTGIKIRFGHLPSIVALDQNNDELEQHLIKYSIDQDEEKKNQVLNRIFFFLLDQFMMKKRPIHFQTVPDCQTLIYLIHLKRKQFFLFKGIQIDNRHWNDQIDYQETLSSEMHRFYYFIPVYLVEIIGCKLDEDHSQNQLDFYKEGRLRQILQGDTRNQKQLKTFLEQAVDPEYHRFDMKKLFKYLDNNKQVLVYMEPGTLEGEKIFEKIYSKIKEIKEEWVFMVADMTDDGQEMKGMVKWVGQDREVGGLVLIEKALDLNIRRYRLDDITQESLIRFIYQYKLESLTPLVRSMAGPEDSLIPYLSGNSAFNYLTTPNRNTLVIFCPPNVCSQQTLNLVKAVAERFSSWDDLDIRMFDSQNNDLSFGPPIKQYPTIRLYNYIYRISRPPLGYLSFPISSSTLNKDLFIFIIDKLQENQKAINKLKGKQEQQQPITDL